MRRRRRPKRNGRHSWSWIRWAAFIVLLVVAGFGVLVWFTPPSKSAKRATAQVRPQAPPAAKPVPAQPTNYSYATPKPTQPLMRTNPTAVPKASGPVVAKTPAPALTPPASSTGQEPPEGFYPRPVRDVAEAQIALARVGISSGSIDGLAGAQTRGALLAFQRSRQLPETGQLDPITREALLITRPPFSRYTVMEPDLARLQPLGKTWAEKAQQTALEYETVLELVAEKSRAHPDLLRRLNPPAVWLSPSPGTTITVPDTELGDLTPCEFIRISLTGRILEAYDSGSNLVAHFPCSIARQMEKRPAGELRVVAIAPNPNYTFNPELFPESAEARELGGKLVLPPGPNNPVGVAWIGLDKPGYGIHGTPSPEQVGRTESHGCFRLANWNAEHLLKIIRIGIPVYVEQ